MLAITLALAAAAAHGAASAQLIDRPSTLSVALSSSVPFSYVDGGEHVVIGEVANLHDSPVTDVRIWAGFYADGSPQPSASVTGTTVIDVVPPFASVPYMIRAPVPDGGIQGNSIGVSVNLLGFTSASAKEPLLEVGKPSISFEGGMRVSGTVTNTSGSDAAGVDVFMMVYNSFEPPLLVDLRSQSIGGLGAGESAEYSMRSDSRAESVRIIASSDAYVSDIARAPHHAIGPVSETISVRDVSIKNVRGENVTRLEVHSPAYVQSVLSGSVQTEFEYIVQVRRSGEPAYVEYIGTHTNVLDVLGAARPAVEWTPSSAGLFFIETFVWSPERVPLSPPGPVALVLVR